MAQAVEYYTLGSAYAEFADDRKGSISEGKLADLVLLSKDLFSIAPREILDTKPVVTIVGGRIVYEQPQNASEGRPPSRKALRRDSLRPLASRSSRTKQASEGWRAQGAWRN